MIPLSIVADSTLSCLSPNHHLKALDTVELSNDVQTCHDWIFGLAIRKDASYSCCEELVNF